ncbi:unnamed protein product [Ilex paraguariensis]
MMMSNIESENSSGEDLSSSLLLRDIEEISKALYQHKTPPKALLSSSDHRSKSACKTRVSASKSKVFIEDLLHKEKKSSIWDWKPLKALTHLWNHRFGCCFFLHVHNIEGLPPNFNDLSLCVNWKQKVEVLRTRPGRICQGLVEFNETLMHRCSVYGSRNGPQNSAKYKPKLFLLYAAVVGAPGLDVGNHWIDLTKLLPLTLEELAKEKRSSGKWTTSFKLMGKAKGAILNVSFGYSMWGDHSFESSSYVEIAEFAEKSGPRTMDSVADFGRTRGNSMLRRLGSVPSNRNHGSHLSSLSLDIKVLDEVFRNQGSELAQSITFLYKKLDEGKLGNAEDFDFFYGQLDPGSPPEFSGENIRNSCDNTEFTVIEQGIELPMQQQLKLEEYAVQSLDCTVIETIDVAEIFSSDGTDIDEKMECNSKDELSVSQQNSVINGCIYQENDECNKGPTVDGLESVLNLLISESAELDSLVDVNKFVEQENWMMTNPSYKAGKMVKSLSLDDVTESVANEFLNMMWVERSPLDIDSGGEPESPRERLLRQFEQETLASCNSIFDLDSMMEQVEFSGAASTSYGRRDYSGDFDLSLVCQEPEKEHSWVSQSLRSKRNVKLLENLETEALMREWGLNDKAFQNSPRASSGGFGSPIHLPPEEPPELPPLVEGFGPIVRMKGGGFLRSINPLLFRNAKNDATLIMQVSGLVVLPAAMGSSIMEILQCWALVGAEKMSMQANELMPLEDITGKTMQQVVWEAASRSEGLKRLPLVKESDVGHDSFFMGKKVELPSDKSSNNLNSSSMLDEIDLEYVSLEDLAPLAMARIEALSVEGLRIQCSMSNEEAPSSIKPQFIGKNSAFIRKNLKVDGVLSSEGAAGLLLLDVADSSIDFDELMSLSISLDEWMRLDAGLLNNEDKINERIFKILAAHHAKFTDLSSGKLTMDCKWDKLSGGTSGFLENDFTVALNLQLRDSFRNYEAVGDSMLALIQVERVYVPLQQEVRSTVSERSYNREEDGLYGQLVGMGINIKEEEKRIKEGGIPRFKISEVHVAGLNAEPGDKQLWGNRTHQQSGSRWLLSSGMGNTNKHLFFKSHAIVKSSSQMMRKVNQGDTLWSISSHVPGNAAKWKELMSLSIHVRNPDIVFPKETIEIPKV